MPPVIERAAAETIVIEALAERLGLAPSQFDPRERFSVYGLDSLRAASLIAALSATTGRDLPPTIVWDYPTIDALAQYLADGGNVSPASQPVADVAAPNEPIAIVGMACRLPGAPDLESYWRLLTDGIDAVTEVPPGRWSASDLFDADPATPGKSSTRWGGFLERVDEFDAGFFGISPREAMQMDPQQRLVAELAWEALEDALIPADSLKGSATGVFIGAMWNEYGRLAAPSLEEISQHSATGHDSAIIANRVSYLLGLEGPSLTLDTACSSSLVAVHLACQSLRAGESSAALAGGVNLMLTPHSTVAMTKFGAMSPDGRCKAFDARANGYVRGEGAGIIVLKTLRRALADGDRVYCVIRGSAVNNDGFSNGLTAPNPAAQESVLRSAYTSAAITPDRVQYVEAHGTGTMLGDPIEANALGRVLGGGARTASLRIGSVKTNVGHLEAAAGIAGVIKTALAIERGHLPPSLHFQTPNPHIRFDELRLKLQAAGEAWTDHERIAGVSSFGFGGTNAHVVLSTAARADDDAAPGTVFVFSGNGSQWEGMGQSLMRDEPLFRETIDACDAAFARAGAEWSIARELLAPSERFSRPEVSQPLLCAFQIALAELLRSWDVVPDAVIGHSAGEIAAACIAGALTLDGAMSVIFHRSRLQQRASGAGAMLFARAGADVVRECGGAVACFNGPNATVASGTIAEIESLQTQLEARGITAMRVRVDVAYHSAQMDPLLAELRTSLGELSTSVPTIAFHSTVTGERCDTLDAEYWTRNMREPVRLTHALRGAASSQTTIIEIGPSSVLGPAMRETLPAANVRSSGRRGEDECAALLDLASHLLVLSARDEAALEELRQAYAAVLDAHDIADVCRGAAIGRAHLPFRLAVVARDAVGMRAKLLSGDVHRGRANNRAAAPIAGSTLDEVAKAWVNGAQVDLRATQRGVKKIALPSYPFQRKRYWPVKVLDIESIERSVVGLREELQRNGSVLYGDLTPALDSATVAHVREIFRRLGDAPVAQRHERLVARLRAMLDRAAAEVPRGNIPPEAQVIFTILDRCGENLAEVLQGRRDPLDLLFPGGDVSQMEELYRSSPFASGLNAMLATAVECAARDLATSRQVRLIEIGGGTGGTTSIILPRLAAIPCQYTFTDVSAHFFAAAREKFEAWPFVECRTFDLERALEPQGFAPQSFDLLVAVNVMHVAADLRAAVRRARSLIRPGGALVIGEATSQHRWLDIVAGVLPGWWNFTDHDLRPDSPLLTQTQWRELLRSEGFDASLVLAGPEHEGLPSEQAVIVARCGGEVVRVASSVVAPRVEIAATPRPSTSSGTAMEIKAEVAAILGHSDPSSIDPARGFFEMGLDSLMAVALRDRIEKRFRRELPTSILFDYPNVDALARHLDSTAPSERAPLLQRVMSKASGFFSSVFRKKETPRVEAAAPPPAVRGAMAMEIRAEVAAILGHPDASFVDPKRGFFEMGLDSLMAVAFRDRLEKRFQRPLPASLLFDYPNVDALARHLEGDDANEAAPRAVDNGDDDPIAIVGLACRFPGARDAEEFWELLRDGRDAIAEVPKDRWNIDDWFDPDPAAPGKMSTRWGGFMEGVDQFDAGFFGVSPREAAQMDPQQRILLETAWHALEDAGETARVAGSDTGVFVGVTSTDYLQLAVRAGDAARDAFVLTGQSLNAVAGRLAYFLGTRGPAASLDTACSSSAVAVHFAAQSIRSGESRMAIAGGVNVMIAPESTVILSKARMMAPDGRCKTFDAGADGFVRAEGCGVVVMKRLSAAIEDGNRVLAVLRGSAINHDGRTSGFTVPNGVAQQRLLRDALARAHVAPAEVAYVEAHGTGTALGDPIEVGSLAAVMHEGRTSPLFLGSVKTAIGHAEAAAGIAGLIKVVLSLQHGAIPPHLHLRDVNPEVPLAAIPAIVPNALTPWPKGPRIAGISSFGASGTNAHLVVEEAPVPVSTKSDSSKQVLTLSAKSEAALRVLVAATVEALSTTKESVADICYTTNAGRAPLAWRVAVEGTTLAELIDGLRNAQPQLFSGEEMDWQAVYRGRGRRMVALPRYPFQRERHWLEAPVPPRAASLLGARIRLAGESHVVFENRLGPGHFPELEQHVVHGNAILPATAFLEMALDAGRDVFGESRALTNVSIVAPLPLGRVRTMQTLVDRRDGFVRILSAEDGAEWTLHAEGRFAAEDPVAPLEGSKCDDVDVSRFYESMESRGAAFGPAFRRLTSLGTRAGRATATMKVAKLDAIAFDAALQAVVAAIPGELVVPVAFERVQLLRDMSGDRLTVLARLDGTTADLTIEDEYGVLASMHGVTLRPMRGDEVSAFGVEWEADLASGAMRTVSHASVIGGGEVAAIIRESLKGEADDHVIYVRALDDHDPAVLCAEVAAILGRGIKRLTIATAGASAAESALRGLARTAVHEYPHVEIRTVDLDPAAPPKEQAARLLGEVRRVSEDLSIAYRQNVRSVARLKRVVPPDTEPSRLAIATRGDVESIAVVPHARRAPGPDEMEIEVAAAALNFKDVLQALGLHVAGDEVPGHECAGIDLQTGDRVMAFWPGAFATHVTVPRTSTARIPDGLTFEEAATIPVAFLTAQYALQHVARLQAGECVLIHTASGGVGLAAIQIARNLGARIFATAGSAEKRDYLRWLGVEQVFDSRSTSFAHELPQRVDVVLNSIAGESIAASFAALAENGRFVEIGKRDIWTPERAAVARPDVAYTAFDLEQIRNSDPAMMSRLWGEVLEAFACGKLEPLRRRAVPFAEAAHAFRTMTRSAHMGKLVLAVERRQSFALSSEGTYLVTGGLGALGSAAAEWLIERGAKSLIVIGRGEPRGDRLEALRARGANVTYVRANVADAAALASLPQMRGIVHAAGSLHDAILAHQTREHFSHAFEAKIDGTDNLRALARRDRVDFLLLFSSAASVVGSAGQANYAAANAYLDAVAHDMRAEGIPALSISWGAWEGSGMLGSLTDEQRKRWAVHGFEPRPPAAMLAAIEPLMRQGRAHAVVGAFDWKRYASQIASAGTRAFVAGLTGRSAEVTARKDDDTRIRLRDAAPSKRRSLLLDHVRARAAHVLGVSTPSRLNARTPLQEAGLDSLLAVELRNALSTSLERDLPTTLLFDYPTIDAVVGYLDQQLFPAPRIASRREEMDDDDALDALSEGEMLALLTEELGPQEPRA